MEKDTEQKIATVTELPKPSGPRMYKPALGFTWNPLLKLPRNEPCPCKSGKKFKHCHLKTMPTCVPIKMALTYKQAMERADEISFIDDETKPYGVQES